MRKEETAMFTELFNNGIFHNFSSRYYGNMKGDGKKASENRENFFSRVVPSTVSKIILADQVHGSMVARVFLKSENLSGTDALVTREKHFGLAITFADCLPLLFADSQMNVIGIAHAGYKGVVGRIAVKTIVQMKALGAIGRNIRVGIGPAICGRCYEFSTKDAKVFSAYGEFVKLTENRGKCLVDLKGIVLKQLVEEAGIKKENIIDSDICTMEDYDYFSARGREDKNKPVEANLAIIGIR